MEDNELIERYLRGELTSSEIIEFESRLGTDATFKELFEIESVVLKSLQFSIEKERIKNLGMVTAIESRVSPDWQKGYNLLYAGGAALMVWLISNIISGVLHIDADLIKWLGLTMAVALSAAAIYIFDRRLSVQLVMTSMLNGLIIFVISSGIDAINQGIEFNSKGTKAVLIPLTERAVWWPTLSLVDSVTQQVTLNHELIKQKNELNIELYSVRDSCFTSRFEKIVPIVVPRSTITASGTDYVADVYAGIPYILDDAKITINGKAIDIERDPKTGLNVGRVKFNAIEGEYDAQGLSKQTFEAAIKIGDNEGQVFKQQIEFFVAKPVLRVTTGAAPTLYMNCGNSVNFEVPALGVNYNPSFSAKGAMIQKGDKVGKVTIIPKERRVFVTVMNGLSTIGTEPFDVKNIPKPRYVVRDNGGEDIDMKTGVLGSSLTGLRVSAEADENFKAEVPKDAVYTIRSMDVILARGTTQVARLTSARELIELGTFRAQFRPGDRLVIEIKTVTRTTFLGQDEPVEVRSEVINIPIK